MRWWKVVSGRSAERRKRDIVVRMLDPVSHVSGVARNSAGPADNE